MEVVWLLAAGVVIEWVFQIITRIDTKCSLLLIFFNLTIWIIWFLSWYRHTLFVEAVEELGLGYIKTWCISYVTFLCHSLVFIDLQHVWSSQCFRACGTMWGKRLSPYVWVWQIIFNFFLSLVQFLFYFQFELCSSMKWTILFFL